MIQPVIVAKRIVIVAQRIVIALLLALCVLPSWAASPQYPAGAVVLRFKGPKAQCLSRRLPAGVDVSIAEAQVRVTARGATGLQLCVEGESADGSLTVDADAPLTVRLHALRLSSLRLPPLRFVTQEDVTLLVDSGTVNRLSDAGQRFCKDSVRHTPACIYSRATLLIGGKGSLEVTADANSGIASRRNLRIEGGALTIRTGSPNGRCLVSHHDLVIDDGVLNLTTTAAGIARAVKADSCTFKTPKCMEADADLRILGGNVNCLSLAGGGKGIVARGFLTIGRDPFSAPPVINVETRGTCLEDRPQFDDIGGSPKAITTRGDLTINAGDLTITTRGKGGEGIEAKHTLTISGGRIQCRTFDDGINAGQHLIIDGGSIYCSSSAEDGIDSNGTITITGGLVVSTSKDVYSEALDAEDGQLTITGGTVFGIGNGHMRTTPASCRHYTTPYLPDQRRSGITLHDGTYLHLTDGTHVIMSMLCTVAADNAFIIARHPAMDTAADLHLYAGPPAEGSDDTVFPHNYTTGGRLPQGSRLVTTVPDQ